MTRTLAASLAAALLAASPAFADPTPTPTPQQLDQAKQAFNDAKVLYDAGKLLEAVEKLKLSYRLSHNAFLLYNIGHTYDQAGEKAKALFFYNKFLAAAPATAPMHDEVTRRVEALLTDNIEPDATAEQAITTKIDFQHRIVETASPGKPVEVAAVVPESANLAVTLFYRGAGDETFASTPMVRHGGELTAQIPADKTAGSSLQYYLEVRDQTGAVVTRSGKPTSPNLVTIEGAPPPRFDEDPLRRPDVHVDQPEGPTPSRITTTTWLSSGLAVVVLGGTVTTFLLARHEHDRLVADTASCGTPPCRIYDPDYDHQLEQLGARYNTMYQVGLGLTVVTAAVTVYLWHRDLSKPTITPTVGDGFAGATAMGRF